MTGAVFACTPVGEDGALHAHKQIHLLRRETCPQFGKGQQQPEHVDERRGLHSLFPGGYCTLADSDGGRQSGLGYPSREARMPDSVSKCHSAHGVAIISLRGPGGQRA